MTDAERWRHIAETKAWKNCALCFALHCYGPEWPSDPQALRMWRALQFFKPRRVRYCHWWPTHRKGDTERTYAALLLAAMADVSEGNHREGPDT